MPTTQKTFAAVTLCALLLFMGCGAVLVNEGSKQEPLTDGLRNPEDNKPKVVVAPEQRVISNFDDGSTNMNPKLYGSNGGSWSAFSYAGNTVNNPFVAAGGANGTPMAAHIFGTLTNKGDGSYPSFTLQGKLTQSGAYDASAFEGIRFYYKCPSDDQALTRRFTIPIKATLPTSSGGTCTGQCYNHFGADLSATGDWVQKTFAFSDLKRQSGWGDPVNPPDFTDHLNEVMFIQWDHNAQNTAGSYHIDYWVDEVEFF